MVAALHSDIPVEHFSRHISPDLPDPVRMRQLFIYGFQRDSEMSNANDLLDVAGNFRRIRMSIDFS
jgi:hypothetical protein